MLLGIHSLFEQAKPVQGSGLLQSSAARQQPSLSLTWVLQLPSRQVLVVHALLSSHSLSLMQHPSTAVFTQS
jgi:outer membrane biogenesis lipoprotein LolB